MIGGSFFLFGRLFEEASQYFSSLFREDSLDVLVEENIVISSIPSLVFVEMNEYLLGCISLEELEATFFQMKKWKAPGPDDFLIEFF